MAAKSVSNSLHFPAKFLEKVEEQFCSTSSLFFKRNQIVLRFSSLKEKNGIIPVSANCKFKANQECILDFKNRKGWINFVGVGGSGLSAFAMIALKQGFEVSGFDIVWTSLMDGLQAAGASLHTCHSVSNIQRNNGSRFPDAIVISSAIPQNNVEILYAKSVGVAVCCYHSSQLQARLLVGKTHRELQSCCC